MARKKHLINVHTSTGTTAPTGASLYLGEIAVQHTPNDPGLWIKMGSSESSTEYEKFIGKTEITNLIQASNILGSGYTYSGIPYVNSATTIADAYSALTRELIDDEIVVASALNDLNARVDALCGSTGDNTEILEYVQENEEAVAGALNNLNERLGTVETQMTGDYIPITGYMTASGSTEEELTLNDGDTVNEALGKLQKQMLDNEEAIAAGLNDLNTRLENVDELIAHNTGVTQLSGAVSSLSAATVAGLQELYNDVENNFYDKLTIQSFSSATQALSSATQALSSATQTFAKATLTVNLNGVEQGTYAPWSGDTVIDLTAVTNGSDVLLTGYELATGTTEEELAIVATDTVNEAFGKIQKQNYDNEAVVAGALNDLDERITTLEVSGSSGGDVEELSGAVVSKELVIAAALNDLNTRIVELSGNTGGGGSGTDVAPLSAAVLSLSAAVVTISGNTGGGGGGTDTACTEAGHYSPATTASTLGTTAATTNFIKGINIDSKKHAISVVTGAVITAQTQLSTATTGTGNVMTDITVSNHQITKNFGMTIPSWATASTKPSYTASEVGALPTGTTLDNVADGSTRKLSNYATTATVNTLNNTVTAHTGDSTVHITSAERTAWNNAITGVSAGGTNVTVTNKVAAIPSASSSTFGVVKAGTFLTSNNGTLTVSTGTSNTTVAVGNHTHSNYATTTNLNNLSGGTTAHTSNSAIHVPTGGTNGQVLMMQNGVPAWVTPSTITYSASAPTGGNDGDIWIQTS